MVRPLLLAAALIAAVRCAAAQSGLDPVHPAEVGLSPDRLAVLSEAMAAYVENGAIPGMSIMIARRGAVPYFETFGHADLEDRTPIDPNTIFRIASHTKAVVSTAIMMLQEDGALSISDPVGAYLPEWMETRVAVPGEAGGYDVVPARRPMTIRDLLTHTSGLGYGNGIAGDAWAKAGLDVWYLSGRDTTIREIARSMAPLPMDAQPGERWVYGFSTDILGAVVEVASGAPLDRFLQARIFDPLGMADTYFFLPEGKAHRLATLYARRGDGAPLVERSAQEDGGDDPPDWWRFGQGHFVEGPRSVFSGGAGLVSTAGDYVRFLQLFLDGGMARNGERILSPASIAQMTTDQLPQGTGNHGDDGTGFGLGFGTVEDASRSGRPGSDGAFGWGGAYHSTYWVDPEKELIVTYYTQLLPAAGLDDYATLRELVYQAIVD